MRERLKEERKGEETNYKGRQKIEKECGGGRVSEGGQPLSSRTEISSLSVSS